jgi:SAM-dependent methyltransferase
VLDDAARYGESFADVYDDWYGSSFDTDGAVERLAALARGGPTLELGVGTGRLAVPLAARGVLVVGVDASPSMLARLDLRLAADPPAAQGQVLPLQADMAEVATAIGAVGAASEVPSRDYRLVFCAYNTFLNLHTEAAQRRCLADVAELLADDGSLVVEAYVPAAPDDIPRTSIDVSRVTTTRVVLTCTEHDPRTQLVTGQHVELTDGAVRLRPWRIRYLSTEQLDAMAADAGLELRERWADWRGRPFRDGSGDEISETHVSVYGRARDQVS